MDTLGNNPIIGAWFLTMLNIDFSVEYLRAGWPYVVVTRRNDLHKFSAGLEFLADEGNFNAQDFLESRKLKIARAGYERHSTCDTR